MKQQKGKEYPQYMRWIMFDGEVRQCNKYLQVNIYCIQRNGKKCNHKLDTNIECQKYEFEKSMIF